LNGKFFELNEICLLGGRLVVSFQIVLKKFLVFGSETNTIQLLLINRRITRDHCQTGPA